MVGKKWMVENLYSRDVAGADLTIEFFADGTVKAFGGCNQMTGTYTLDGDKLTFGPMASTKKSCGAALDEQEYSFSTFLAIVERVEPDGDDLLLHSRQADTPIVLSTGGGGLFW
ncbi:MAG: META domain-containing protein [Desulfovibrionaceae bacterium]|nr:META domain-containing protein [Desulfovibrionaceae bacterium]